MARIGVSNALQSVLAAVVPKSAAGWRTMVSGGSRYALHSKSSKPTMDTARGHARPSSRIATNMPRVMRLLHMSTAVGLSASLKSSRARR